MSKKLRWRALLGLAIPLALAGGTGAVPPEALEEAEALPLECMLCLELGGEHAFAEGSEEFCEPGAGNNGDCAACGGTSQCHTSFQSGPCHVDCAHMSEQDTDQLVLAAAEGDVESLLDVMARVGDVVLVNTERSALQAKGCDDEIVLHVPVSTEVLDALADALQ